MFVITLTTYADYTETFNACFKTEDGFKPALADVLSQGIFQDIYGFAHFFETTPEKIVEIIESDNELWSTVLYIENEKICKWDVEQVTVYD
jgi:hypothetical protein